jgi:hypothetical protein
LLVKVSTLKDKGVYPKKKKEVTPLRVTSFFFYFISRNALHNWSGQEVERFPHFTPSNFDITSSTFIPFTKRLMP